MSHRNPQRDTRRRAGAKSRIASQETRRNFLRVSGAGAVGFTLGHVSQASADDDLNAVGLEVSEIVPVNTLFYDPLFAMPAHVYDDLNDGQNLYPNPDNVSFELDADDNTNTNGADDPVTYNNTESGDLLEVDLTVLEAFEENYDPDPNAPGSDYTITDPSNGSIGING